MARPIRSGSSAVVWCVLMLAAWLPTSVLGKPSSIEVTLDPRATLFYHLECLSGGVECSQADIRELWVELVTEAGVERITRRWASIMDKYAVNVPLNVRPGAEWPDLGPSRSSFVDLRWRIQAAAFAADPDAVVNAKLAVLMSAADMHSLEEIAQEVLPLFLRWWSRSAGAWKHYARTLQTLANSDIESAVDQAERLYQHPGNLSLTLHLMPRPVGSGSYRGFQKDEQAVVEFSVDDDVTARAAVVVHELCHFLYASAPDEFHQSRIDAFNATQTPAAGGAFAIMNEVLATAVGNGSFMRQRMSADQYRAYAERSGSFYRDIVIDSAAKAAMPLVAETLAAGRTFDRAFFDRYFATMQDALSVELASPPVALRASQIYVTASALQPVAAQMARRYGLQSTYTNVWNGTTYAETTGYRYRNLSVAILAHENDSLDALRHLLGAAAMSPSAPRLSACKARRESGGWVFLFIVPEGRSDIDLETALANCRDTEH